MKTFNVLAVAGLLFVTSGIFPMKRGRDDQSRVNRSLNDAMDKVATTSAKKRSLEGLSSDELSGNKRPRNRNGCYNDFVKNNNNNNNNNNGGGGLAV